MGVFKTGHFDSAFALYNHTACQTGHFYICPAAPFAAARARARETRWDRLLALLVISVKRT